MQLIDLAYKVIIGILRIRNLIYKVLIGMELENQDLVDLAMEN